MKDVTKEPMGAVVGLMGWPYPGHGGTLWRDYLLAEGWRPDLALDGHSAALRQAWDDAYRDTRAAVLEQLRADYPILSRWSDSIEWLQSCGRGDVVAVMSLHTGAILSHCCLGWRDDYRDESGALWNWAFAMAAPDPLGIQSLRATFADASGCVLDRQGEPTTKVLVRPAIGGDERDGLLARWQESMGEALLDVPPVRTLLVEHAPVDWGAYEDVMARAVAGLT